MAQLPFGPPFPPPADLQQGTCTVGPAGELAWGSSDLPVWMMPVDSGVAFWLPEDGPSQDAGVDPSMDSGLQQLGKAPRLRWTLGLHQKFLAACNELGGPLTATPKNILTRMGERGLTLYHVKSHLQKFRAALREGAAASVEPAVEPSRRRRRRRWGPASSAEMGCQGVMDSGSSISWAGSQREEEGHRGVDPALLQMPACLSLLVPEQGEAQEQGRPQTACLRQQPAASPPLARLGTVLEAGTPEQFDEGTSRRAFSAEAADVTPAQGQADTTGVLPPAAPGAPLVVQEQTAVARSMAQGKTAGSRGPRCTASPAAPQGTAAAQEAGAGGEPTVAPAAPGAAAGALEPGGGSEKSRVVLLQQALARQLEMQQELQKALQAQRELASRLQAQQETIRSLFSGMRASSAGTSGAATATAAGPRAAHASASNTATAKADTVSGQCGSLGRGLKRSLSSSNLAGREHVGTTLPGRVARHSKRGSIAAPSSPATPASLPVCASASGSPHASLSPFTGSLSLPLGQQQASLPLTWTEDLAVGVDAAKDAAAADVRVPAAQANGLQSSHQDWQAVVIEQLPVNSSSVTCPAALLAYPADPVASGQGIVGTAFLEALAPTAVTAAAAATWNSSCASAFLAGIQLAERQRQPAQPLEQKQTQEPPCTAIAARHSSSVCSGGGRASQEVEVAPVLPIGTLGSVQQHGCPAAAGSFPGGDTAAIAQACDSGEATAADVLVAPGLPGYPLPDAAGTAAAPAVPAVPAGVAEAAATGAGVNDETMADLLDGLLAEGEALDGLLLCDWSSLE